MVGFEHTAVQPVTLAYLLKVSKLILTYTYTLFIHIDLDYSCTIKNQCRNPSFALLDNVGAEANVARGQNLPMTLFSTSKFIGFLQCTHYARLLFKNSKVFSTCEPLGSVHQLRKKTTQFLVAGYLPNFVCVGGGAVTDERGLKKGGSFTGQKAWWCTGAAALSVCSSVSLLQMGGLQTNRENTLPPHPTSYKKLNIYSNTQRGVRIFSSWLYRPTARYVFKNTF
jgi:hypothetical protein